LDKKYSAIAREAFERRSEADYDVLSDFTRDEIEKSYYDMKDLVAEIENHLSQDV